MPDSAGNPATSILNRLTEYMRVPLYRNAYALVLSSGIMSGLGFFYWMLAARTYTTEAVGLNSLAISTMTFLAWAAQLNLGSAMIRFIPKAGDATRRLVKYSYAISALLAFVASLGFLLGADVWTPELSMLTANHQFVAWFTLATVAWAIFALQDGVLVGLRQATWLPIENTVFAVTKIVLLLAFARVLPQYGVFASWSLPAMFLILPINALIFRVLIPRHLEQGEHQQVALVPREIVKYTAGDYVGSMIQYATFALLPIIVVDRAGASANAYFYLPWTMTASLYLVSTDMGLSLTAEGSAEPGSLASNSLRIIAHTGRLVVPLVAVIVLAAPYILRFFGSNYAEEGTMVLRLLAISALPHMVSSLAVSALRVLRRVKTIVLIQGAVSAVVLPLSYLFLDRYGIAGVGAAVLLGETAVAAGVLFMFVYKGGIAHLDVSVLSYPLSIYRNLQRGWVRKRLRASACQSVPAILDEISACPDMPSSAQWSIQGMPETSTDTAVVILGAPERGSTALLKLPQTDMAVRLMRRQAEVLLSLHADPRLDGWSEILPHLLCKGETGGQTYFLESSLPGINARAMLTNPASCAHIQTIVASSIGELHRRTSTCTRISEDLADRWVDEPLTAIRTTRGIRMDSRRKADALGALKTELHEVLVGHMIGVSWVHGDLWPGNVLVSPDGGTVTGIVDWEFARTAGLPMLDLMHLLLVTRMTMRRYDLGDVVQEVLSTEEWTSDERHLLDAAQSSLPGDHIDLRSLVLLCWLRHVGFTITRFGTGGSNWLWVAKNITRVLQYVTTSR